MPTNLYDNQISIILKSFLTVWTNQSDKYEIIDYCLNPNGILPPPPNLPRKYLTEEQIKAAKEDIKNNEIKQIILDIAMNLFITDSTKFIESIIDFETIRKNLNPFNRQHNIFLREFFKDTAECTLDASNRMVIPKRLVTASGLKSDIAILGLDTKIEIWDQEEYEKSRQKPEDFALLAEKILGNLGNL